MNERETCKGCGNEIDPEVCCCGTPIEDHGYLSGHGAIPMGCDCGRDIGYPIHDDRFK